MRTSDFEYNLPPDRIAQRPVHPRDGSRLLLLDRKQGEVAHYQFLNLPELLSEGDLIIWNSTKVFPARLIGSKIPTGGKVELLLLKRLSSQTWESMVGGRGLITGRQIKIHDEITAEVKEVLDGSRRIVKFNKPISSLLPHIGEMPLPPYITTPLQDPDEYQTVYAKNAGSAAAPTAGLHFTKRLDLEINDGGIRFAAVDLQIGLDTFAPVTEKDPEEHPIHTEWCRVPEDTVRSVLDTHRSGNWVVAVGTTTVRALEMASNKAAAKNIEPFEGATDLYILPGYKFRVVDSMITNFHLPRSTLLMMVSAFVGRKRLLDTYQIAVREGYRFYSFGDAMLIL